MLAAPVAVMGLPGSSDVTQFYRRRGQLKAFLVRVGGCSAALQWRRRFVIAVGNRWFSRLIFGGDGRPRAGRARGLRPGGVDRPPPVLTALFNALRMTRIVSAMQFFNSLAFAALGVGLLCS